MLMRALIIFLFFSSTLTFGQDVECDCAKFATGNFYMLVPLENKIDTLYIIRTESEQTEIFGEDYNEKNHVIWLTPCKFILRDFYVTTSKKYHKSDIIIEIIETYRDSFIVKVWAPHRKKLLMTVYVQK